MIGTCNKLGDLMKEAGASNFKVCSHHIVKFCSFCGADLAEFYGANGGALRDDEFLRQLKPKRMKKDSKSEQVTLRKPSD